MAVDDSKMIVSQETINPDKDHKLENRLEFPHANVFIRHKHLENHQSSTRPPLIQQPLPCEDVKEETYSWMKHTSLLVSLNHHRRTNNNRIINIKQLVLVMCFAFISLLTLSTTAEAKKNANLNFDHLNAKPVQFHGSTSSVLVPMQTSVSYSTAYSDSRLPSGFNKNKKRPGTVRNVSKFRKNLNHKNSTNNANISSQAAPNKVIDDRSSIDRPFFTKITSDDAIAKPSSYFESIFSLPTTSSSTSRPKDTDTTVSAISKPSKLFTSDKDDLPTGLTSATEKSFLTTSTVRNNEASSSFLIAQADSGPKIRLEPFFNFLSNFQSLALGTSKEQNFSPSYQTITQSINENTKKTKANKFTKGMRERKKKKIRNKAPKIEGPIPIPLPERVVGPDTLDSESDDTSSSIADKSMLHPMDVLNIPMNPPVPKNSFSESVPSKDDLPMGREALDSHTFFSMDDARNSTFSVTDNTRSYLGFDKYNQNNESETDTTSEGDDSNQSEGEGRLRSGSIIDNFHDQDVDLQAEESVTLLHMDPSPTPSTGFRVKGKNKKKRRKGSGRHVNIPPGFTTPTDIDAAHSHFNEHKSDPQRQYSDNDFNPIPGPPSLHYNPTSNSPNRIRDDLSMISKYPISFDYNPGAPTNGFHGSSRPNFGRVPQNIPRISNYGPTNKLRPNLNGYYGPNYHKFAAPGETNGFPASPVSNGYVPPYTGGSHYVGHTLFGQDDKGSVVIPPQTIPNPGKPPEATSDLDTQGSSSDTTFNVDVDKSSNSNQKIGIMNSFDLFYTNYKVLAWATFFIVTSLALLAMLLYLYVNNPPTEVVQARENYFSVENLLGNPQILKFLSSLVENHQIRGENGKQKRRRFKKESMQSTADKIKKQL